VRSITRAQAEAWLSGKKETTGKVWAAGTQRTAHAVPSQIWDRAIAKEEEIARRHEIEPRLVKNLWRRDGSRKGVRGPRVRKTRVEFLRKDEAARLLRSVKGTRYAAWVAVGLYAGLRGGEAANLRLGIDVDLSARVLRIQGRGGEYSWRVKNPERGQRTIPMHPRLARWIKAHIKAGYAGEVYLFRQPGRDRPIGRGTWRVWTRDAFTAAGIQYGRRKDALVTHSLRHTFASWLTQADVHPVKIAALMGDTVEMVISTYSHLIDQDLGDAIRRL
jgi:integrase